jgi:hypothetical protein
MSIALESEKGLKPMSERLDSQIAFIDIPHGQRLYSLRDWVFHVSSSKNKNLSAPWSDLKKAIKRKGMDNLLARVQIFEMQTSGGRQLSDFADEETLIEIKRFIEQTSHNKLLDEVKNFHPQVIKFLQNNGWEIQHHIELPSGKVVDMVAHCEEKTIVLECKPNLAGQRLFLAIGQVLCYATEYGNNSYPALATTSNQVSEYVQQMCSARGIQVFIVPNL